MRSFLLALPLVALPLVACSAAPSDDATTGDDQNQTGVEALNVIKGREWGRCFFKSVNGGNALVCSTTKRGDKDPLQTPLKITASSLSPFAAATKELDTENGGTVVVGTFTSFPVIVIADAVFSAATRDMLGIKNAGGLQKTITVNSAAELSEAQPLLMKQPFDLWPTGLIAERADGGFAVNARYEVPTGDLAPFASEPKLTMDFGFFSRDYKGKVRYFVAPASGGVEISNGGVIGSITGPGYWTVGSHSLRGATPEEISRDFGSEPAPVPAPAPDGNVNPNPTPDPIPVEPAPVDPTPGCGNDREQACRTANGAPFCDAGNRYDSNQSICRACGKDGQTYCANANGSPICNDGTRYDSNQSICRACGTDGLTYCVNANGSPICNDGTRYDSNQSICRACGTDGLTYCVNANGSPICNAGNRYDSNQSKCLACGNAGQTYCVNANGSPICNAGNRYDSNSGKCVTQ